MIPIIYLKTKSKVNLNVNLFKLVSKRNFKNCLETNYYYMFLITKIPTPIERYIIDR